ncbi:DDE-type integrase/transposase/recombinase [Rhodoferax sp. BLA1]|uniref:DDE-type integrase/transposase/recombinase n=1 Tax=Rhodoferax sp. BLA1 TaxID=2576062 RepID=UPI0015D1E9B0|nr:DDE-type integrase/transposase/recombinase [Rhodoferax sp. BLA1]
MLQISFIANQPIRLFSESYVVQGVENDQLLTLRSDTGATRTLEIETLLKHYTAGNLKAFHPRPRGLGEKAVVRRVTRRFVSDMSPKSQSEGFACYEYLRALASEHIPLKAGPALTELLGEVTKSTGRQRNPSISSLKRWQAKAYRSGGDVAAVMPRYDLRGGRNKSRMPPDVQNEMNAVIDNMYLTTEGHTILAAYEDLVRRVEEKLNASSQFNKTKIPSYSTFRRAILARNKFEVAASRNGAKAAERMFRSTNRSSEIYSFNECWEIDHTVLDLMVVDPKTKLVLGRPRVTAVAEYSTGSLMGFDIDFSGASAQAVLNCLKHAITPKTYLKERFPEVQGEWPCHGVPMVLKMDNGVEFHSKSLKDACFELGIELQFCPVAQPWFKGRIERFFRTLNESLLNSLPGATGINLQRRKDVEDANLPVLDLDSLQRILHIWIVDVYMTMPRKGRV